MSGLVLHYPGIGNQLPLKQCIRLGEVTDPSRAVADRGSRLDDRFEDGFTGLLTETLIGHVRRRYLQYLANSAVGFRVAHLSGSDVRQPDRHRCPLVRAVRSARRAADRSASIPPVERGNPNRRTASPVSATSDQVLVQSPDSGHSPAGQLHLPPEALRRDRPGQCDQAVRPDRLRDAVVS